MTEIVGLDRAEITLGCDVKATGFGDGVDEVIFEQLVSHEFVFAIDRSVDVVFGFGWS